MILEMQYRLPVVQEFHNTASTWGREETEGLFSSTLLGHYLDDMSNVDGAAAFLGLAPEKLLPRTLDLSHVKKSGPTALTPG